MFSLDTLEFSKLLELVASAAQTPSKSTIAAMTQC